MSTIWKEIEDSLVYVKGTRVSLQKVEVLEKQLRALLNLQKRRVAYYDTVIKTKYHKNVLKKHKRLRKEWQTLREKYKKQEFSILKKIEGSIKS